MDNKLDNYHYFEIMDRAYIAVDTFNEHIVDHPAVQNNPELKTKAEEVADILYNFYCLCGAYMDGPNKVDRVNTYRDPK